MGTPEYDLSRYMDEQDEYDRYEMAVERIISELREEWTVEVEAYQDKEASFCMWSVMHGKDDIQQGEVEPGESREAAEAAAQKWIDENVEDYAKHELKERMKP